jgi:phage terminase Nu1 subunit (DNA packaging protein)
MTKSPAQIRREAEENIRAAHEITGTPRIDIPTDSLARYREEADAVVAAERAEIARHKRAARSLQRQRERALAEADVDERVRVAVAREVAGVLDALSDAVGGAVGQLLKQKLDPVERKLGELERLLDRLQALPHDARSASDYINVN